MGFSGGTRAGRGTQEFVAHMGNQSPMGGLVANLADLVGLAGFSGLRIEGDTLVIGGDIEGFGGGGHGATIAEDSDAAGAGCFFFPEDSAIIGVDTIDSFVAGDKEATVSP